MSELEYDRLLDAVRLAVAPGRCAANASPIFASQIRSNLLESARGARTDRWLSRLSPAH